MFERMSLFDKMRIFMTLIDDLYIASEEENHELASDLYLEIFEKYQSIIKTLIQRGDFKDDKRD